MEVDVVLVFRGDHMAKRNREILHDNAKFLGFVHVSTSLIVLYLVVLNFKVLYMIALLK